MPLVAPSLRANQRPDAFIGENFQQQRMFDAAVYDVHALDAVSRRIQRRADLGQHAPRGLPSGPKGSIFFGVRPGVHLVVLATPAGVFGGTMGFSAFKTLDYLPLTTVS